MFLQLYRRTVSIGIALCITSCIGLCFSQKAVAHQQAPAGVAPFVRVFPQEEVGPVDNLELAGGGTTWGLVLHDEAGWQRVCEEAPPASVHFYAPTGDDATDLNFGKTLVGTQAGLWITDDGCAYESIKNAPIQHTYTSVARAGLLRPAIAVAAATPAASLQNPANEQDPNINEIKNGVFLIERSESSADAGALIARQTLFTDDNELILTLQSDAGLSLQGLTVDPNNNTLGRRLYAAGIDIDQDNAPIAYVSEDAGNTWRSLGAEIHTALPNIAILHALGEEMTADGPVSLWGALSDDGTGSLLHIKIASSLGVSDVRDVIEVSVEDISADGATGTPTAYVNHVGMRWMITDQNRLYLSTSDDPRWILQETGPTRCLLLVGKLTESGIANEELWGCGQLRDGVHFFVEQSLGVWRGVMPYSEVKERICPTGSAGFVRCRLAADPNDPNNADGGNTGNTGNTGNNTGQDAGGLSEGGPNDESPSCGALGGKDGLFGGVFGGGSFGALLVCCLLGTRARTSTSTSIRASKRHRGC